MSRNEGKLTSPGIKPVIPQLLGEHGCDWEYISAQVSG